MSNTVFEDLVVEKTLRRERLRASLREDVLPVWLTPIGVIFILFGVGLLLFTTENLDDSVAALAVASIPISMGLYLVISQWTFYFWDRLSARQTFGYGYSLSEWSLKDKLKDAEIIAAERVGRFELAALLGSERYQALVIDRSQKEFYTFKLNAFAEPERALLALGKRLERTVAQHDVAKLREEAEEQAAKRLAERILADI